MTSSTVARAVRLLRHERRRLSAAARHARASLALARGSVRLALQPRFALRKQRLLLGSAPYLPGLFSQFATVLGLLEHYDRWRDRYDGVEVDFGRDGLYYDPRAGENWWSYYFEPVAPPGAYNAPLLAVNGDQQYQFARRVETTMPRRLGNALIGRYIRPKPWVVALADAYVRENFSDVYVIGVHYRGTDKHEDAPRVSYEQVYAAILEAIGNRRAGGYRLFVATDEQVFLDFLRTRLAGEVYCLEYRRSVDGKPIDVLQGENYAKGESAVMDCLLLARCHTLVRTASNLSLCSTLFNPDLPLRLLNPER